MRFLFLILLAALPAFADVLDDIRSNIPARVIPWSPGVRGGITNYTYNATNSVVAYGAVGDGTTECHAAFTNALARCPVGYAVWVPNGTYKISTNFNIPTGKVLRGESATNAVIDFGKSMQIGIYFGNDFSRTVTSVSSAAAGQSNIVVGSATGFSAGRYAVLLQTNDPAVVFGSLSSATSPWQGQMFQITNVSGTTMTMNRPVYWTNYASSLLPAIACFSAAVEYAGIEDLKLSTALSMTNAIAFYAAANCWLKNVATTNFQHQHVDTWWAYALEIRECRMENHFTYDSNARYALALARNTTDCLIENNIFLGHNLATSVQQGACGNVFGYNFTEFGFGIGYPTDTGTKGGMNSHGDNPHYNLYEGNVTPWIQWDDFWGSDNRETAFRNWMTRKSFIDLSQTISLQGTAGLFVDATNYHMTAVGNIIGHPRDSGDPDLGIDLAWDRRNSVQKNDLTLTNTFFNHENFEFRDSSTTSSNGYSATLPNSFYLTSKPSWFGTLAWPAIGPDVNTTATITNSPVIPAQARWLGSNYTDLVSFRGFQFGTGVKLIGPGRVTQ